MNNAHHVQAKSNAVASQHRRPIVSGQSLPAPVVAAQAKQAEIARNRRIALADAEGSTKTSNRNNEDEEDFFLEDDTVDEPLRFDVEALNLGLVKDEETGSGQEETGSKETPSPSLVPMVASTAHKAARLNVEEQYLKRAEMDRNINLVVIGHVDAGKSTLMGHLLVDLKHITPREMATYTHESAKLGKASFAFAWVLDETADERNRGVTVDVAVREFTTANGHKFTLLDAPGHKDFIPNMISGAAQADVAILVVDAGEREFERGFEGGQTKEHCWLVRSLGVQRLICVINKMDTVHWSEERYTSILARLSAFLSATGFKRSNLSFLPASGFVGENLTSRSDERLRAWYTGPTLVNVLGESGGTGGKKVDVTEILTLLLHFYPMTIRFLEELIPPLRPIHFPLRFSVTDVFKGFGGISVAGRIESGTVQIGEPVTIMPGHHSSSIRGLIVKEDNAKWAAAGDSVILTLGGLEMSMIGIGSILCPPGNLVKLSDRFLAQIVVLDVIIPITIGYPIILHHHSANESATITGLVSIIDKISGKVIKKNPRHIPKHSSAMIEVKMQRPIPLETFADSKGLGRVLLRKGGETLATGIVMSLLSTV